MRLSIQMPWACVRHSTGVYPSESFLYKCPGPLCGIIQAGVFSIHFHVAALNLHVTDHKLVFFRFVSLCWAYVWHSTCPYFRTHFPVAVFGLSVALVVLGIIFIVIVIILASSQTRIGKRAVKSGETINKYLGQTSLSSTHNLLWGVPSNI